MREQLEIENKLDENGRPGGGTVKALGISIAWQVGPLGYPPKAPNGAFVEDVIEAARQRLAFYQTIEAVACKENAEAIRRLEQALNWLKARRADRKRRGVQGTYST